MEDGKICHPGKGSSSVADRPHERKNHQGNIPGEFSRLLSVSEPVCLLDMLLTQNWDMLCTGESLGRQLFSGRSLLSGEA